MDRSARERQWADWLKRAMEGDARAYEAFLTDLTPYLRAAARRRSVAFGAPPGDAEDMVQEVLLAVHLKRGTWDPERPLGPWLSAILRNKLIDSLRRRGHRVTVAIEDVMDLLAAPETADETNRLDAEQLVARLGEPQRDIVRSISLNGASVRETAARLNMSEGAVRVALHRALKALSGFYRSGE